MSDLMFVEKKEQLLKKIGNKKEVAMRALSEEEKKLAKSLQSEGKIKCKKKEKKEDCAAWVLTEKGRKYYKSKFLK